MKKPFLRASLWAALVLGLGTACSNDTADIDLAIEGATEAMVVRIEGDRSVPFDTVAIVDGHLSMELPVDSTLNTFYFLLFDTGGSMRLGIAPGDEIQGTVDATTALTEYSLTGSRMSEQLLELYRPVLTSSRLLDSLDVFRQNRRTDSADVMLERENRHFELLQARYLAHRDEIQGVLGKDSTNLANVFAFFQQVGQVPIFRPGVDLGVMQAYAGTILEAHPKHPLAQIFAQEVERLANAPQQPQRR
jgi:hypothetical protein